MCGRLLYNFDCEEFGCGQVYAAVCRTATLLTTRFTGTGFWMSGLRLFEAALAAVTRPEERKKITSFIKQAHDILGEQLEREENTPSTMGAGTSKLLLERDCVVVMCSLAKVACCSCV